MDDITSRLRGGLHRPEAIILGGVTHDQRCLIAADEIERLRAVISNARAMVDHVIHGEVSITSMQDIHSDLSKALKEGE
jgi:hypothetical protein